MMICYAVIFVMLIAIALLIGKIASMKRGINDIRYQLIEKLSIDTNTLISISSNDKELKLLADTMNHELKTLRSLKRKYKSGDRELKEAITNMSHDLRTPLTAILGYIELLKSEDNIKLRHKYLNLIEERALSLKALTQELFSYSLVSSEKDLSLTQVNLCACLEDALIGFYKAFTDRGIEPSITMPDEPIIRMLDKDALSRILGNILNNALKYSDGDLEINVSKVGRMSFSNTAAGLSELTVGRLFDRFYTVESAKNSTGLGLSIAKSLTEKLGGRIWAEYSGGELCIFVEFGE